MENTRINLGKASPKLFDTMRQMEQQASAFASSAGWNKGFTHLLKLRASQINECAYCVRLHTRDALNAGESTDRISVVAAWRETGYFTEKERAAFSLIEAITLVADEQIPDSIYAEAAAQLSPEEIAAVEWLGVVINAWNRIAISSRYPVNADN